MGYRSDVALSVIADSSRAFDYFIMQFKLWHIAEFGTSLERGVFEGWQDSWAFDARSLTFFVRDVKWYNDYPDVQRIEQLWQFIVDYVDGLNSDAEYPDVDNAIRQELNARFMRIGEEYQDVEVRDVGLGRDCILNLSREILVDDEDDLPWGEAHPLLSGTEFRSHEETEA